MLSRSFLTPLKRLFPQRIAVKLALVITALVIVLLSMLGLILSAVTQNVLKADAKRSQEEIAVRAAGEISLFMKRPVELLTTAGQFIGKTDMNAWDQETVLVQLSLDFPIFEEVYSLTTGGKEIASSSPGRPSTNWKNAESFRQASAGKSYLSSIRVGDDHMPHLTLAIPYYRLGKVSGVLIAQVNLRGLWKIVDSIRIGKTGRAFLISSEGLMLAHPDKRLVLQNIHWTAHPALRMFEPGRMIGSVEFQDQGKRFLSSYASVEGPAPFVTVIQMDTHEAYRLLDQMRILIWLVVLLSSLISATISFALAQWLVQPVKSLERWSKKVTLGNYDYFEPAQSVDEMGRLFVAFKRMSQRLKKAREKEHLAVLGETATMITHKLKNSIVSLKTFAQLFPQRKHDKYFIQKFEANFSSTIDYLEKMFKNFSQIASYRCPAFKPISITTLLHAVPEHYDEILKRYGIECRLMVSEGLPEIQADQEQMKELFDNLIQNAIQAMPHGGVLTLETSMLLHAPLVYISVKDTGIGIAKQHVDQIFKPFFSTKHGGMGLGLAIAKKIVEDHGGDLKAQSSEGHGAIFTVRLPVFQHDKISVSDFSSEHFALRR